MNLPRGRAIGFALLVGGAGVTLALAVMLGAVFGAVGRHSTRFPLNLTNSAADSLWNAYQRKKNDRSVAIISAGDSVTFSTIFTSLRGKTFPISIGPRGGDGGATTSVGDAVLLLTHDGRFFGGDAETGFRQLPEIAPPPNGYDDYFERTHRPPYDPSVQNYGNFRYNDIVHFETASASALLASYSYFDGERECYANRISRFDFETAAPPLDGLSIAAEDWRLLFESSPCLPMNDPAGPSIFVQEAAGRLVVESATNTIYLASGNYDAANPSGPVPLSQDPGNDYGKVLAIDLDSGESRLFAMGFRNPQGIAQDRQGRIWTVGHGPRAGDELNLVVEGGNYGFPYAIYGSAYSGGAYPNQRSWGDHDGYDEPALAWLPSIGPGTVLAVDGFDPAWDGNLLVGALSGRKLINVRIVDDRVVYAEEIPVDRPVRHLHQHTDGSIILWNGRDELMILTAEGPPDAPLTVDTLVSHLEAPPAVRAAAHAELEMCTQCHSLRPGDSARAPSLADVFEEDIGSTGFPANSPALENAPGEWSRDRLMAFLGDADGVLPGTIMPDPEISDAAVRDAVVDVLQELNEADGPL